MSEEELRRRNAFAQFVIATKQTKTGTYNLDLSRHAKVFSTAPTNRHEDLICIIEEAAKLGHVVAAQLFGEELYNWARDNDYKIS